MEFEKYLFQQLEAHPSMQPRDIVKLCYQAAYGPNHLLSELDVAEKYFCEEYENIVPKSVPLYENISDDYCRVNLAAWKAAQLPSKWLFEMFAMSLSASSGDDSRLQKYLDVAQKVVQRGISGIAYPQWQEFLRQYKADGMPAVHHSDAYREAERPSYRVVDRRIMRMIPVLQRVLEISEDKPIVIIAIDGRAASGKSTMAEHLKTVLDGEVIHMDDFFLPGKLRTAERLAVPGSNVHYERFMDEVMPAVRLPQSFAYRKFDCGVMDYVGNVEVSNTRFRIVEGAYSCHPEFGDYADVRAFSDVEPDIQMQRIIHRNGSEMAEIFKSRWIPMEEAYFKAYGIMEKADIIV